MDYYTFNLKKYLTKKAKLDFSRSIFNCIPPSFSCFVVKKSSGNDSIVLFRHSPDEFELFDLSKAGF